MYTEKRNYKCKQGGSGKTREFVAMNIKIF